ncbi:PGPGW domain-containing protein [Candidatus Gracilibacteria bacterium]|nr:PGPGW domain-containing protein [Candidatus Gracilibacteria bacterium]MCF7856089.1 PGPGW domain-containing protein [Candidatus Gracilibacteria bacterium]MCF7896508.1 PGPGW domain-containing protein [Candidatus Gracilibacteria bacterium]
MKKEIKRFFEIVGGGFLILAGIVMLVTPGQGVLAIVAGIFLISPQHGKRVVWWGRQLWRGVKGWWFSWRFKRVIRRRIFQRAEKLKKKFSKK